MSADLLSIKQNVAKDYIQEYKQELNWFQKLLIWPIEKNLQEAMVQDLSDVNEFKDLDTLNWWGRIVAFNKTFAMTILQFIKEKSQLLNMANTREELARLQLGITSTDTASSAPVGGVADHNMEGTPPTHPSPPATSASDTPTEVTTGSDGDIHTDTDDAERGSIHQGIIDHGTGVAGGMVGAGVTAHAKQLVATRRESANMVRGIDVATSHAETQRFFAHTAQRLQLQAQLPQYTPRMSKNLQKLASGFEDASRIATNSETRDALGAWKKVGTQHLTPQAVEVLSINPTAIEDLTRLVSELDITPDQWKQLRNGNKLRDFLETRGYQHISDDMVRILQQAENPSDMKNMARVMSRSQQINTLAKAARAGLFLELAFIGVDVWLYSTTMKEAENMTNMMRRMNHQQRARLHAMVGVSTSLVSGAAILSAAAGLIATGPAGWVVIGVGATSAAISFSADSLYFDTRDFYLQDLTDYIRQSRTEVQQAVLQLTYGLAGEQLSLNDRIHRWMHADTATDDKRMGLEQAWEALIYIDDYMDSDHENIITLHRRREIMEQQLRSDDKNMPDDYKNELRRNIRSLDDEIQQERESTKPRMQKRMAYIEQYMDETQQKPLLLEEIKAGKGMKKIQEIVRMSAVYVDMLNTQVDEGERDERQQSGYVKQVCRTIEEYKQAYHEQLMREDPVFFATLDEIRQQNPHQLHAWSHGLDILKNAYDKPEEVHIRERATYMLHFIEWAKMQDDAYSAILHKDMPMGIDYNDLLLFLETKATQPPIRSSEYIRLRDLLGPNSENLDMIDDWSTRPTYSIPYASPYLGQNIMYRIAREFHGYSQSNDIKSLIEFYDVSKHNALGIYYHKGRTLNKDWALDTKIRGVEEWNNREYIEDTDQAVATILQGFGVYRGPLPANPVAPVREIAPGWYVLHNVGIDTATESIDVYLQREFIRTLITIVQEEVEKKTPHQRREVEQSIYQYAAKYGQDGYIELPKDIVQQAITVGIGDLGHCFIKADQHGRIQIYVHPMFTPRSLHFLHIQDKVSIEHPVKTREQLTQEERDLLRHVDQMREKVDSLRGLGSLNIPIEFERMISHKMHQREQLKYSLHYMSLNRIDDTLRASAQGFYQFFQGIYIGLLHVVDTSLINNNVNSGALMEAAWRWTAQEIIHIHEDGDTYTYSVAEGLLQAEDEEAVRLILENDERIVYNGKSRQQLIQSYEATDRLMAQHIAQAVIQSVLESKRVTLDEQERVTAIASPWHENTSNRVTRQVERLPRRMKESPSMLLMQSSISQRNQQQQLYLHQRLEKNIAYALEYLPRQQAVVNAVTDLSENPKHESVVYTSAQRSIYHHIEAINKEVTATDEQQDWGGKRGPIIYDAQHNHIRSWGQSIEVDPENMRINGLEVDCSPAQLVATANLLNRFVYYIQHNEIPGALYARGTSIRVSNTGRLRNTVILTAQSMQTRYPHLIQEGTVDPVFIDFLNNLVSIHQSDPQV